MESSGPIILYDGVCGLCNRSVQFMLDHDRKGQFRFASLQSPFATALLQRHGRDPGRLETVYVVLDHGTDSERLLQKARAVLWTLRRLGLPWSMLAACGILPTFLLDFFYSLVARTRYRIFGKYETCRIPSPATRARFIDV
jgi:predicted DCC family thiol-disulfide oxidoreductase YuxK